MGGTDVRPVGLRLVAVLAVLASLAAVGAPGVAASTRNTSSGYHLDLYRSGVFVTQYRWTWCVGASSQMMLNIIQGTSNTTFARQKALVTYAMNHDAFLNSNTGGTDATGFAAALNHYGAGTYKVVMSTNFRAAVRKAAIAMRKTNKPVGLLVMGGRHAWVMSGFDATADPAATNNFDITGVYVLGPLYPKEQKGYFDKPPDTLLTFDQFRTPFHIFDDPDSPQFDGYWVTVNPS
jgi:hypothetical protein